MASRSNHKTNRQSKSDKSTNSRTGDRELAARYGCPVSLIAKLRRTHGIRAYGRRSILNILPERILRSLLGKDTDQNTARKLGVALRTIVRHRDSLGIPAYFSSYKDGLPSRLNNPKMRRLLGSDIDRNIARQLNVSLRTVIRYRKALGIGPANQKHKAGAAIAPKTRNAGNRGGNHHGRRPRKS